jgi:hypothetical protein
VNQKKESLKSLFMKKSLKKPAGLWPGKLNIVVDDRLTQLQGKIWAPEKLEEVNKRLSKMKGLPKI